MKTGFYGGVEISMKVPPHQYDATVAFYRDVIGLQAITGMAPATGFHLGPNKLWIEEAPGMSQAEIWLELLTDDFAAAAQHLAQHGVVRCDAIEPLPMNINGGWYTSPASIVHLVREP